MTVPLSAAPYLATAVGDPGTGDVEITITRVDATGQATELAALTVPGRYGSAPVTVEHVTGAIAAHGWVLTQAWRPVDGGMVAHAAWSGEHALDAHTRAALQAEASELRARLRRLEATLTSDHDLHHPSVPTHRSR